MAEQAQPHPTVREVVQESILTGIHPPYSFKNGHFVALISPQTWVVEALQILSEFPQLSAEEQLTFLFVREHFHAHPDPHGPWFTDRQGLVNEVWTSPLANALVQMANLFIADAMARGVEDAQLLLGQGEGSAPK